MDNQFPPRSPQDTPSFPPPPGAPQPSFPPPPGAARPPAAPFAPPPAFAAPAVKTPGKVLGGAKPLVLPRRASPLQRAQEASAATAEARRSIDAIFSQSRTPWGGNTSLSGTQVDELQKAIRNLEAKLAERDMALNEAQAKLAERERELAETEAVLAARERVIEAAKKEAAAAPAAAAPASTEQMEALKKLKEELDRQEASVKEARQALKDREEFLEQSEAMLFSKMQAQQEKETELEQREEDLKRRARQLGLVKDEPPPPMEKA